MISYIPDPHTVNLGAHSIVRTATLVVAASNASENLKRRLTMSVMVLLMMWRYRQQSMLYPLEEAKFYYRRELLM